MSHLPNNPDWRKATRMIDLNPVFGIACYEGKYDPESSHWDGDHVGVYANLDDAEAWLRGEETKPPRGVYGSVGG